jgi:hypothetical protein
MANTLGTVVVDLKANAAHFVSELNAASSHAKRFASETTEAFSKVGEFAGSALAPFGEIGREIGETFVLVGNLAGKASAQFAELGGGMSVLAVGAGVAAAAIAGVSAAAIGLAIHTAESVREMADQARMAGVSISTYSALAFAAKQADVPQEVLTKSLGKLSAEMLKASVAAPGTVNAFSRLGLSVKDNNGQLKDAGQFFGEVIEKLDGLKSRTAAVGFARQIFGKGGGEVLKFDPEEMNEAQETAKKLGLVIGPEFAEASTHFVQSMNVMKAAGEGVALKLTEQLLPTLQLVADEIIKAFENNQPAINAFVERIANLVKSTVAHLFELMTMARNAGMWLDAVNADAKQFGESTREVVGKAAAGIFNPQASIGDAVKASQDGSNKLHAIWEKYGKDKEDLWKKNSEFVENITGPRAPWTLSHKGDKDKGGFDDTAKPEPGDSILARIKERLKALGTEVDEWRALGQAGSQAQQLIADATKKGTEEFEKLSDTAAHEKDPHKRATDLALVTANKQFIEGAAAAQVYGSAIKSVVSDLDKQHLKLQEETSAAAALAEAYNAGDVASALISAHFADQAAKVRVLKEAHDQLAAKLGEEDAGVKQLADGYALASKELDAAKVDYAAKVHADLNLEISKATTAFENELPALRAIGEAYFDTAEAARAAQVELRVAQFRSANPLADEDQVNRTRQLEQQKSDQSFKNSVSEQAAKYDLLHSYQEEVKWLEIVRGKLEEKHSSTLLLDAAEYDAQRRLIEQWDEAALKNGTFAQKFRASMNQVVLDGQNFGAKLTQSIGHAIDGLASSLAKFIVTGKGGFKQLFQSFEEEIVKAGIQKGFSSILGKLLGGGKDGGQGAAGGDSGVGGLLSKIPVVGGALGKLGGLFGGGGGTGKADGSQSNPFYVIGVGDPTQAGGAGGLGGLLSSFTGAGQSDGGGGGLGSFMGILGAFGGFLAGGGDVTPGKAYVVGEKHPEFFVPGTSGTVAPSLSVGGTTQHHIHMHLNFPNVRDHDSFKKSSPQINAHLQHQAAIAYQRTRS